MATHNRIHPSDRVQDPSVCWSHIYTLCDPRDGRPRYVGRTIQRLGNRLQSHTSPKGKNPRVRWVAGLLADGVKPRIELLETVPLEDGPATEEYWTELLRFFGADLLNVGTATQGAWCIVRRVRWTPEIDAMLGRVGDAIIAEELGVTRKAVSYRRAKLGIPASFDKSRMKPPPPKGGWNKVALPPAIIARLGTAPDYALGAEAGVCKTVIARHRRRRGIRPYAEATGNNGQYRPGNYPDQWLIRAQSRGVLFE